MAASPANWIELISRYGPIALFVFMVFVLLGMARATKGLSAQQKKVQNFAFGLVWLSIFVLAGMIVVSWWHGNFPQEFVVRGTISNLTYPQTITTFQPVFLHRRPVAGLDFEYDWRFISPDRFTGPLELLMQKGVGSGKNAGGTALLKYKILIQPDFYREVVDIAYDPATDVMVVHHGSFTERIMPTPTAFASDAPETTKVVTLEDVVYASTEKQVKTEELIKALDVDDPLIRANSRRELIALDGSAVPDLERALITPDSSYRLRVGILSTLKEIPGVNQFLSEKGRCAIAEAAKESDSLLSAPAEAMIKSGVSPGKDCPNRGASPGGGPASAGCVSEKVGKEELQFFTIGQTDVPVYLAHQSQGHIAFGKLGRPPDNADIIVLTNSDWLPIAVKAGFSVSRAKRGYLKQELGFHMKKDLMRAALAEAGPQAYVERRIDNGNSFQVTVDGTNYTIAVKTHYLKDFAEVTICPST